MQDILYYLKYLFPNSVTCTYNKEISDTYQRLGNKNLNAN